MNRYRPKVVSAVESREQRAGSLPDRARRFRSKKYWLFMNFPWPGGGKEGFLQVFEGRMGIFRKEQGAQLIPEGFRRFRGTEGPQKRGPEIPVPVRDLRTGPAYGFSPSGVFFRVEGKNRVVASQGNEPFGIEGKLFFEPPGVDGVAPPGGQVPGPDKGLGIAGTKPAGAFFLQAVKTIGPGMGTQVPVGQIRAGKQNRPPGKGKGQIQSRGGYGSPLGQGHERDGPFPKDKPLPEASVAEGKYRRPGTLGRQGRRKGRR
jgi:hypothetical protein